MSLTYGFYSSRVGDRRLYYPEDFASIFDGIITEGVYRSVGDAFLVRAYSGKIVTVGSGRAWFNHTWTYNDSLMDIELPDSHYSLPRYDAVVLEVDTRDEMRRNAIKVISGNPATIPNRPSMPLTGSLYRYPLAYIFRPANSDVIEQADIEIMVGTTECPYIRSDILSDHSAQNGEAIKVINSYLDKIKALDTPEMHRVSFRGKYLGNKVTEAQLNAIRTGTFEDLYLGDYWEIDNMIWRIADFNYWYNVSDTWNGFAKNHIVLVADRIRWNTQMEPDTTVRKSYVDSFYRTRVLTEDVIPYLSDKFGTALLTHREYLCNGVDNNGVPTSYGWYDCVAELPSASMIFGGGKDPQLALFQVSAKYIRQHLNSSYMPCWLRDNVGPNTYSVITDSGILSELNGTTSGGSIQIFAIG